MTCMRWITVTAGMLAASLLHAQSTEQPATSFEALRFLEGNWQAKASGGDAKAESAGTYVFRKELDGHVLARHGSADTCKGPADFDCDHHDLLYVFQDAASQPLKAIYFDNEGHVIHYDVFASPGAKVEFLSSAGAGPRFRLTYELQAGIMAGKFQMQMPGQADWKSYLEWSGPKK